MLTMIVKDPYNDIIIARQHKVIYTKSEQVFVNAMVCLQ